MSVTTAQLAKARAYKHVIRYAPVDLGNNDNYGIAWVNTAVGNMLSPFGNECILTDEAENLIEQCHTKAAGSWDVFWRLIYFAGYGTQQAT